jgi:hypothetical protein
MSTQDGRTYEAGDGTTFDVSYRGQDVELYVAGDNTIIASPRASDDEESEASDEGSAASD